MRIAILSRNADLYSTKRLVEAGEKRGYSVRVIDYLRCYINYVLLYSRIDICS